MSQLVQHPNAIIVSIEGNIGSGKSTILRKLKETYPDWVFVDEPVADWLELKNENGESLLEVFYKDKRRWSYTFQNAAVLHRYKKLRSALECLDFTKPQVIVMERSIQTDRMIFCRMLHKDGFIDDLEKKLYEQWFEHINLMLPPVDALIFINTSPDLCLERISMRAREGESIIPIDYLKELDVYHRDWLFGPGSNRPVLEFDNHRSDPKVDIIHDYVMRLMDDKVSPLQNR